MGEHLVCSLMYIPSSRLGENKTLSFKTAGSFWRASDTIVLGQQLIPCIEYFWLGFVLVAVDAVLLVAFNARMIVPISATAAVNNNGLDCACTNSPHALTRHTPRRYCRGDASCKHPSAQSTSTLAWMDSMRVLDMPSTGVASAEAEPHRV